MGVALIAACPAATLAQTSGPASWQDDLTPIRSADWSYDLAAHLLERAGFGGTPAEITALADLTPSQAIGGLIYFDADDARDLPPFVHSGIHDAGLEPFPPSRPAVTDLAKETGAALPPSDAMRRTLVAFLDEELGTSKIERASSYMEDSLRLVLHLIMSQPEYQLG